MQAAKVLTWDHVDDGGVTRLDLLGVVLELLSGTTVNLLLQLGELAGDVSSVAIQHWGISSTDLTGVVQDDNLWRDSGQKSVNGSCCRQLYKKETI